MAINLEKIKDLAWQDALKELGQSKTKAVFSTSFGVEDQVIIDFIATNKLDIDIFTLDTGRLFTQTHKVWQETQAKYAVKIKSYHPDPEKLNEFSAQYGINGFYDSVEARKACCDIRKVQPLHDALEGYDVWISGLRSANSASRAQKSNLEFDENFKIHKFYPLLELSDEQIWQEIEQNEIPYNELHDQGFPSIGCAPCTRAVRFGADPRSGRWWWEDDTKKECGLHVVDGKLVRKSAPAAKTAKASAKISVIYITETLNSKKIATEISAKLKKLGNKVNLKAAEQYQPSKLAKEEF